MKLFVYALFITVLMSVSPALSGDVPVIDKDELKAMLGSDDLIVLDVRAGRDWTSSELQIKGAKRGDPGDVPSWIGDVSKGKKIVLYCA